jgi:hypothetical protein
VSDPGCDLFVPLLVAPFGCGRSFVLSSRSRSRIASLAFLPA